MTAPTQHPASNSESRKRSLAVLTELADVADRTTGLPGYFIAPDAFDDMWVWRERGDYPVPLVAAHDMRDDPDLWAAIVRVVEGA